MEYLLVGGRTVYTPVVTLARGKERVIVVGVIHIGTESYYRRVRRILERCEVSGWAVLRERLMQEDPCPVPNLRVLHRTVIRLHRRVLALFLERHNLVSQLDYLKTKSSWIDADTSPGRQRLSLNREQLENLKKSLLAVLRSPDGHLNEMARSLLNPKVVKNKLNKLNKTDQEYSGRLITGRDNAAVDAVIQHLQSRSVVTFWGPAHVPGIVKGLEQKGLRQESVQWLPALRIHPPSTR